MKSASIPRWLCMQKMCLPASWGRSTKCPGRQWRSDTTPAGEPMTRSSATSGSGSSGETRKSCLSPGRHWSTQDRNQHSTPFMIIRCLSHQPLHFQLLRLLLSHHLIMKWPLRLKASQIVACASFARVPRRIVSSCPACMPTVVSDVPELSRTNLHIVLLADKTLTMSGGFLTTNKCLMESFLWNRTYAWTSVYVLEFLCLSNIALSLSNYIQFFSRDMKYVFIGN